MGYNGSGQVRAILDKALAGRRITPDDCLHLLRHAELAQVGEVADAIRARKHPSKIVTYIVDRNINYTNICVAYCKFCAFYRPPKDPEGYVLTREQLARKIEETIKLGGVQILLQGGHHPTNKLDWYEDLLRWIKSNFKIHIHGFSSAEIQHFVKINKLPLRTVLERLAAAGLDTIPGGGAEILVDRVRNALARNRCSTQEWLDVHREWHKLKRTSTATTVIGHIETLEERVEHLRVIRDLQDETGGFTAFIMWTMQTENTDIAQVPMVGGYEYLRNLAIIRIFLDNFQNLQSSWVTQGGSIGQLSLRFGANDMGSTMIEENVVSQAGACFRMTEQDIRRLVQDAGFIPRRRNCYYDLLE